MIGAFLQPIFTMPTLFILFIPTSKISPSLRSIFFPPYDTQLKATLSMDDITYSLLRRVNCAVSVNTPQIIRPLLVERPPGRTEKQSPINTLRIQAPGIIGFAYGGGVLEGNLTCMESGHDLHLSSDGQSCHSHWPGFSESSLKMWRFRSTISA